MKIPLMSLMANTWMNDILSLQIYYILETRDKSLQSGSAQLNCTEGGKTNNRHYNTDHITEINLQIF